MQDGQKDKAVKTLNELIKNHPLYLSAVGFLADIYIKEGNTDAALKTYQKALKTEGLSAQDRVAIEQSIAALQRGI